MGKPVDPLYWRKWRAAHPEYRKREAARPRRHHYPGEYHKVETLPALYPDLNFGKRLSFWDDELRMDLAQEWQLALLEHHDPAAAVAAYRRREYDWRLRIVPLPIEQETA